MKILIYGLNFSPETMGVGRYTGEMAAHLKASGHDVRVITALPYYPAWRISEPYTAWKYAKETIAGVTVWRAPLYVPKSKSGTRRLIHLFSFALLSIPLLIRQLKWRPDLVWMAAPTIFCAPAALAFARLTGAKSWLHIQDFELDIAFSTGLLKHARAEKLGRMLEKTLLTSFDRVSTISVTMLQHALVKGIRHDRTALLRNWVNTTAINTNQSGAAYRDELAIPHDAVVALYSGSMGVKQGVDIVAASALRATNNSKLYFVLCGDGAHRAEAEKQCGHLSNVRFLDFQPEDRLGELLAMADIHLLPQKSDSASMVLPSKLAGMLASGRPILTMATPDSELANLIEHCGSSVPFGDIDAFTNEILILASNRHRRQRLGEAARKYAVDTLDKNSALESLSRTIAQLMKRG